MNSVTVDLDVLSDAVALACRAPSLHNSQPWRFISTGDVVSLFLDPDSAPRHTDTSGRELIISCGAVLDHFRVAMAAVGYQATTDRFPNPNNPNHLCDIEFRPAGFVAEAYRQRAEAIRRRHTDRLPFAAPPHWDAFAEFLEQLPVAHDWPGVSMAVLPGESRADLIRASEMARTARRYDSAYHAELFGWTTPLAISEGIPAGTLASPSESERVAFGREFPTPGTGDRLPDIATDESRVIVLSTEDSTRDSLLRCGEMLSSILLDATMAGLATCTLSHLTEVPASRRIVAALTGSSSIPQVLVRIGSSCGHDDLTPKTPRRPVSEVLRIRE
ncbi:NAD(P)H nitroreductase [Mycobacterium sp. PSTR-4-N]|uniref:Acg family FMN-binding oxidoreductase n=1 Tax=Mycobacterium sp. PSTR-4-N TaxID=2917745 RepID=UPI001F149CBE|nr:NAD(P)H nitroreductase [Mycobacterium sp. PSTR-4-N]MCG7592623.1 NAD(P)H nitroreductase [Mycobacterium sp. PSTR-4-N]